MNNITSEIRTFDYPNGEIQRVQIVRFGDFSRLRFLRPEYSPQSFERLCALYRDFIIKKYAKVFGKIVIYTLPDDDIPFQDDSVFDPQSIVTMQFKKHVHCRKHELVFDDEKVRTYFLKLREAGCLFVAEGLRDKVGFLPVGKEMGYLSRCAEDAELKVNSSFFVFDQLDCGSSFDHVGIPVGLMVENGKVLNPPQFERQAFLVHRDGKAEIRTVSLKEMAVTVGGSTFRHGENAEFYERPASSRTPKGACDIVVLNNRIAAICRAGGSAVPSGGFIIRTADSAGIRAGDTVSYEEMKDIVFGIQVGNSAVIDGVPTKEFISPFYNFLHFWKTSYPPSMYPLNYEKSRAPRIVLGADKDGCGILLWYEGAGKFGYEPGVGSCGASLSEAAAIAKEVGMANGVHLDGGGSAQILLRNRKSLACSDRSPDDFSENERAVPVGLFIDRVTT